MTIATDRRSATGLLTPLLAGALVMVALGVYGRVHTPTGFAWAQEGSAGRCR
ncbi:DUF6529 family protein [Nonomuraea dietziae]|uniref:DUF6529 family protein n=1 Tax=Nonomuraea dietziae TaxID=65515 RepID=UPI0031D3D118